MWFSWVIVRQLPSLYRIRVDIFVLLYERTNLYCILHCMVWLKWIAAVAFYIHDCVDNTNIPYPSSNSFLLLLCFIFSSELDKPRMNRVFQVHHHRLLMAALPSPNHPCASAYDNASIICSVCTFPILPEVSATLCVRLSRIEHCFTCFM